MRRTLTNHLKDSNASQTTAIKTPKWDVPNVQFRFRRLMPISMQQLYSEFIFAEDLFEVKTRAEKCRN